MSTFISTSGHKTAEYVICVKCESNDRSVDHNTGLCWNCFAPMPEVVEP